MKWDPKRSEWQRPNSDGPPDLILILKNFFGFKSSKNPKETSSGFFYGMVAVFISILIYIILGFYVVRESERGICLRFGRYIGEVEAGLHWRAIGIDQIYFIDMRAINSLKKENMMLTADENLVYAGFEIQYRRSNPRIFLTGDANPILTLQQLSESCIRDVIGHSNLDDILTTGKQSITHRIYDLMQQSLAIYQLGIELIDVNLSFALPPESVRAAFNDVTRAREDKQTYQNEALRYRENQVPIALGAANRIKLEAEAYREEQLLRAMAQIESYKLMGAQYSKNPDIVRLRSTIDALTSALKTSKKIVIDESVSNPLIALGDVKLKESQTSMMGSD